MVMEAIESHRNCTSRSRVMTARSAIGQRDRYMFTQCNQLGTGASLVWGSDGLLVHVSSAASGHIALEAEIHPGGS